MKPTAVKGTRLTAKLWEFDEPVESALATQTLETAETENCIDVLPT